MDPQQPNDNNTPVNENAQPVGDPAAGVPPTPLPQDGATPAAPPSDPAQNVAGDDHPQTDANVDSTQAYNEGQASASGVTDQSGNAPAAAPTNVLPDNEPAVETPQPGTSVEPTGASEPVSPEASPSAPPEDANPPTPTA
jgi:hypothetical protein